MGDVDDSQTGNEQAEHREFELEEAITHGPLVWDRELRKQNAMTLEEFQAYSLARLARYTGWLLFIIALVVIANAVVAILVGVSLAQDSNTGLDPFCIDYPELC